MRDRRRRDGVRIGRVAATALAILVGGAVTPIARQDPLPAAKTIIARHVAAIGGEAAFSRLKSIRARGRFEMAASGISGDVEILSARPAKLLHRVTLAGIGVISNGYDGKVAWLTSPVTGPELLAGRMLSEEADDAWFDAALDAPNHVREATTLARTDFDNRSAFKVKVVFTSGNEETQYFDAGTGLEIGVEATRETPSGLVPSVNVLREYRKFGALLQPAVFAQRALGFEQVVTITSYEYNVVSNSAFDLPAEIKALMKQ